MFKATADTFIGTDCRHNHGGRRYVLSRACVECQRATTRAYRMRKGDAHRLRMREHAAKRNLERPAEKLWRGAKERAANKNLVFTISVSDTVIPDACPLLGIPLRVGKGRTCAGSPTLDRILNDRGYVSGNVWVISNAANTCKSNLSAEDILLLGARLLAKEKSLVL